MRQLKSIQALRGIAALAVFFCHLISIEQSISGRSIKLTTLADSGAYGVDLFFVISGFVMVWVASDLQRGWHNARSFLIARASRIYPLWWVFAGLAALGYWGLLAVPWDAERVDKMAVNGTEHLLRSFALLPQDGHPVLGAGWSLVHEVYFYIGFSALILCVPVKWRFRSLFIWGGFVLAGAFGGLSTWFASDLLGLIFHPLTLQFLLGAFVAYAVKAGTRSHARLSLAVSGVLIVVGLSRLDIHLVEAVYGMFASAPLPDEALPWRRTILFGAAAAGVIYGLVAKELLQDRRRSVSPVLTKVGDWSYSLYLCHMLTISVAGRVVYSLMGSGSVASITAYFIATTCATLLTAYLSYRFIERPLIAALKRRRRAAILPPAAPHVTA